MEKNVKYQLRNAAGLYWILDVQQKERPYRAPLAINEVGADIWEMLLQGKDKEEIVEELSHEYQVEKNMIAEDVEAFWKQLQDRGYIDSKGTIV